MFSIFCRPVFAGAALAVFSALSACTVVTEEPPPYGDRMCTQQYDPVCAVRGGDRRTFPNDCIARAEDYRIVHGGACRRGDPRPPRPDRPSVCTQEYAPVCGIRDGDRRTFANDCLAAADGYRVLRKGECR